MPTNLEMIQEAVKRGISLPPDKAAIYDEAIKRGLVKDERVSTMGDVAWSALSSIPKGISTLIGMPKDLGNALGSGVTYGLDRLMGYSPEEATAINTKVKSVYEQGGGGIPLPTGAQVRAGIESVTGPLYEPKTRLGKFADTTGQFLTGSAVLGAGGVVPRILQGVVPGVASEGAGQMPGIEGTKMEPWVRGGVGLATGLLTGKLTSPSSPQKVVADAISGTTKDQMNKAISLMQRSREPGGVPLTWPEAIQHVTNGRTTLDDVARFVENSRAGGPVMREFFADRPQRVQSAVADQADAIDPIPGRPEVIGPNVQRVAQGAIDDTTARINNATRPYYNAAHPVRLSPAQMQAIRSNPAYDSVVTELRKDKYLGAHFKNVPDDSIEMIDAVQKVMRGDAAGLKQSTAGVDRFAASEAGTLQRRMVQEAKTASPEYDAALTEQARLRSTYLEPLEKGPTGKLAATDDVRRQVEAIFPANPASNSQQGVGDAISALAKKDPQLAANVVGQHIDRVFAEAAQKLASGPNQTGGAKFAAVIAGNTQQAKNLEAAIRALPGGDSKWVGFKRLLENLEATGRRKPVGSPTDMYQAIRADLKSGGLVGETLATVGSPARWTTMISDAYRAFRLGKNTELLAKLFADPTKGEVLTKLALYKTGSPEAVALTARALFVSQANNPVPNPNRD